MSKKTSKDGVQTAAAPQFNIKQAHHPKESQLDDLHSALRSCNEIGSAKSMFAFMMDIQKLSGGKIPSAKNVALIKNDRAF
jgi:hypothetical protein